MLPSGWRQMSLSQVTSSPISYGVVQTGEPVNGGVPCVRVVDLARDTLCVSDMITTSQLISDSYKRTVLALDDIMFALRGEIGLVRRADESLVGCNLTRGVARIAPNRTLIEPAYLFWAVQSPAFTAMLRVVASGSALQEISIAQLRRMPILFPSKENQRRVVDVLTAWERAIEVVSKLVAWSEMQKKALMRQLLTGKKRFPQFSEKWKVVRFSRMFERVQRKNSIANDNVLTISGRHGLISQREFFSKSIASENLEGYTLLHRGEFAYNRSYSNGYPYGAIKPLQRYDTGVVSSLYLCFRLKDSSDGDHDFFRHYFESGCFAREIYAIAQEGARNHGLLNVSAADFFNSKLHIPAHSEQKKIAEAIGAAEREISNLKDQLQLLRRQKRALMQQLLTGKRRVKLDAASAA